MAENDVLEDLLLPKEDTEDPNQALDTEEMKTLKAELDESKKAQAGLLKNVQDERRKRQEIKGRLDQVTTTVNSILEQREQLAAQSQSEKDKDTVDGIPVEFDENGDAFVPHDKLSDLTSQYEDKIALLEEELAATQTAQASSAEYQEAVAAMVGEKPEFADAHRRYQTARKWVSDVVADWSLNNNVNRPLNSGEALTHVIDEDVISEFNQRFPGLDIVTITTAEDSPFHFKSMLQKTAEVLNDIEPKPTDSRFRQVINKPSSLGKSANAKGSELSLAEKVGSLSTADIMNLGDEQIEALSNYLKEDEEKDGINW